MSFCGGKWSGPRPQRAVWGTGLLTLCCTARSGSGGGCKTLAEKCFTVSPTASLESTLYSYWYLFRLMLQVSGPGLVTLHCSLWPDPALPPSLTMAATPVLAPPFPAPLPSLHKGLLNKILHGAL